MKLFLWYFLLFFYIPTCTSNITQDNSHMRDLPLYSYHYGNDSCISSIHVTSTPTDSRTARYLYGKPSFLAQSGHISYLGMLSQVELASYLTSCGYTHEQMLNQIPLYALDTFIRLVKQFPEYAKALTDIYHHVCTKKSKYRKAFKQRIRSLYHDLKHQQRLHANKVQEAENKRVHQIQLAQENQRREQEERARQMEHDELHSIASDWQEAISAYKEYDPVTSERLTRRLHALNEYNQPPKTSSYELSSQLQSYLKQVGYDFEPFESCHGTVYQQILHKEAIDIVYESMHLINNSLVYDHQDAIIDWAVSLREYNQAGSIVHATHIADLCWALLDCGKAILEGACDGLVGAVRDCVDHPVATAINAVAEGYVLAYHLSKVVFDVAGIGITAINNSDEGYTQWKEYIAPITNTIAAIQEKEIAVRDVIKGATHFAVQWKAQGILLGGLNKFYHRIRTKALDFARAYTNATPHEYMATPEGVLCNVSSDLNRTYTNQASNTNSLTNHGAPQRETILPRVKTYEQARNMALKIIGSMNHPGFPHIGALGVGEGKIVGRKWFGKKVIMRLDYDPLKGPHINVNDYRLGKGIKGISVAVPFEGDLETVKSLLKHLNR